MQQEIAMRAFESDEIVRLEPGQLLDIHDGEGIEVTCVEGALWITQSHDPRDIVIETGESFTVQRSGLTLLSAPASRTVVELHGNLHRRPASALDDIGPTLLVA
jgi:hypothetical protein